MEELGILNLENPNFGTTIQEWGALIVAGQLRGVAVNREAAGYLCWAWRQLYAEIIDKRVKGESPLNLKKALWHTIRMAYSRVKAYGRKWRLWYVRQRLWQAGRQKEMPEHHQKNALILFDNEANYVISDKLIELKNGRRI